MKTCHRFFAVALVAAVLGLCTTAAKAEEVIEKAGVAVGVSAGNMWFLPVKAISMSMGALGGALSFVLTGGNLELSQQIWRDTSEGPYVITPELARTAIGKRPELAK